MDFSCINNLYNQEWTMKDTKDNEIRIRLTSEDKELIETNSIKFGFISTSDYLRYIGKNTKEVKIINDKND